MPICKSSVAEVTSSLLVLLEHATRIYSLKLAAVAVLGTNIWGAWPLIIWEATTVKRN